MWGNEPKETQYKQNKNNSYPQPRNIAKMSDVGETKTNRFKEAEGNSSKLLFPKEIKGQVKNPQTFLEVGRVWHIHIAAKKQVKG